jgi:molybdenum cofactor cytidylyltransferase/nicotine blue oxidoreductase
MKVNPSRLAILLLAAGQGNRLGNVPKALLKKEGIPLIQRFWQEASALNAIESISVLGFYADQIKPLAEQYSRVAINLQAEEGHASSVRLGLESLHTNFDLLLIALVDQPRITQTSLELLINTLERQGDEIDALVPLCQGQRGNPIVMRRRAVLEILNTPVQTPRQWLDQHPKRVCFYETQQDAFIADVDTPDDIKREGLELI